MASTIDSQAKRARLAPRKNPYWSGVSGGRGGISLGYRKVAKGAGSWIAKAAIDGARFEERLAPADDDRAPAGAMTYTRAVTAALEWGRRQYSAIEAGRVAAATAPTVRMAVETYICERKKRSEITGSNAASRLKRYVLADKKICDTTLSRLQAASLDDWRSRLPTKLASSTVNRLLNDFRAALNAAAQKHRRELSAHVPTEIKAGTKAGEVQSGTRRQLLSDAQVRSIVRASFEVDSDGDFGRVVMLAAATGARYSQLAALTVGDVQAERLRIMIPPSKKGRARTTKAPVAVPIDREVMRLLAPAVKGRASEDPLLLRWAYRRTKNVSWQKSERRPLGAAYEIEKQWALTVASAKIPSGTVMYALRHSSIVRSLRENLPVRLVAALHDTSIEMIEAHYSAYIVDLTEELSRRSVFSVGMGSALQAAE